MLWSWFFLFSLRKFNLDNETLCDSCENSLFISSVHSSSVCVRRLACASPKCHLSYNQLCGGQSFQFILPTHCKNDIWPEPRSEDVFKELDHAFQPMSKSWRLRTIFVSLRRVNFSPPARWRGWQRRWPAWSPPSETSPTAPQSHDRSQHHLQSLVRSWSKTAYRLDHQS